MSIILGILSFSQRSGAFLCSTFRHVSLEIEQAKKNAD
jgi:hypothetical protein